MRIPSGGRPVEEVDEFDLIERLAFGRHGRRNTKLFGQFGQQLRSTRHTALHGGLGFELGLQPVQLRLNESIVCDAAREALKSLFRGHPAG